MRAGDGPGDMTRRARSAVTSVSVSDQPDVSGSAPGGVLPGRRGALGVGLKPGDGEWPGVALSLRIELDTTVDGTRLRENSLTEGMSFLILMSGTACVMCRTSLRRRL